MSKKNFEITREIYNEMREQLFSFDEIAAERLVDMWRRFYESYEWQDEREDEATLLHYGVGDQEALEFLIVYAPWMVNLFDANGFTALYRSAMHDEYGSFTALLDGGADAYIRSNKYHHRFGHLNTYEAIMANNSDRFDYLTKYVDELNRRKAEEERARLLESISSVECAKESKKGVRL